jgi:hypothetical protein
LGKRTQATASQAICRAIRARSRLEFQYGGLHRVVEPYCLGISKRGAEVLRAVQIRGESRSGGFGFGKLWLVADMADLRITNEKFVPSDPDYNPDDRAMSEIYCRV